MNASLSLFPLGWQHYLLGGAAIGAGVALLFALTGLVGGMSSVFSSTWSYAVSYTHLDVYKRQVERCPWADWQS